jgi:DNA-binding response OmpR family regulator
MSADRKRVLVAHDSEAIRAVIAALLGGAGYAVDTAENGVASRAALAHAYDALVLDVALPDVLAFELIAEAKRRRPALRIILVASIYNRTSYKRRPTSLYGADDYVEQHHIADALVGKVEALLRGVQAPTPMHLDGVESEQVRRAALGRVEEIRSTSDAIVRAERLAKLIVSDIALYNGDAVAAARSGGGAEALTARLRADLEEGRLLFDLRVPATVRAGRDFIAEALAELIGAAGGAG